MANYNLVVNSRFLPFSYLELYTPLALATQALYDIEDKYSELSNKANVWKGMVNKESDYKTYKQYEKYSNDLLKAADLLVKEGLTPSSRKGLFDLRSRYSSEITPIELAYQARAEELKEQRAGRTSGMVYEGDASIASLDRYLGNTNVRYNMANSQEGYKRVAAAANALSKQLSSYGPGKRIDAYTKTWLLNHGYQDHLVNQAINDIRAALNGNPNLKGQGILLDILNQEMLTAGVANWKNNNAKLDYFNRISPAIYEAVGQTNVSPYEDRGAILAAQQRASQQPAAQQLAADTSRLAINPRNIYSSKDATITSNNITTFSKYFYTDKNGNRKLTKEGLDEYRRKIQHTGSTALNPGNFWKEQDSPFKVFMDSLGATKYIGKGNKEWLPGNVGNLWNLYLKKNESATYDATKSTEFVFDIDASQRDDIKDKVSVALKGLDLQEVDYDHKKNAFVPTGNTLDYDKFGNKNPEGEKYEIVSTEMSPYGNTMTVSNLKGEIKRYKIPKGINTANENNRDKLLKNLPDLQQRVHNAKTPEEKQYYQSLYDEQLNNIYLFQSQLFNTNKTKPLEFKAYGY